MTCRIIIPTGYRTTTPTGKNLSLGRLWTPELLTTEGWYDASDASTITESGGAVSQWDDKSGNARHLKQVTGANQPQTGASNISGLNAIDYDGTNDTMESDASSLWNNIASGTIIGVVDTTSSSGSRLPFNTETAGGALIAGIQQRNNQDFRVTRGTLDSDPNNYTTLGTFPQAPSVMGASWNYAGNNVSYFHDANSSSFALLGAKNTSATDKRMVVGSDQGSNWQGLIGEVVVTYDITTDTIEKIQGYLAHKWGLTANLDAGHPYKTVPPLA